MTTIRKMGINLIKAAILLIVLVLRLSQVQASEIVISSNYTSATCDRTSFQCPNLRSAVSIAETDDVISLLPGYYQGRENLDICGGNDDQCAFSNVTLRGIGRPEDVVIDGNGTMVTRGLYVRNSTFWEISNLTYSGIQNNTFLDEIPADLNTIDIGGAAISVILSLFPLKLKNVHFTNNAAAIGAVLRTYRSSLVIVNCLFENNFGGVAGGAIFSAASNLTIFDSDFRNNNATSLSNEVASSGGAIYFAGESSHHLLVKNCRFKNNLAQHFGGAILAQPNSINRGPQYVVIKNCYFEKNIANGLGPCLSSTSCDAMGGALYLSVTSIAIESSVFVDNAVLSSQSTKTAYGGAVFCTNLFGSRLHTAKTTIHNCNFTRNSAYGSGGAIYGVSQALDVQNSYFGLNYVTCENPSFTDAPTYGGAIWYSGDGGLSTIQNSTFFENYAQSGWGGAIFGTESCSMRILSSKFVANQAISSYTNAGNGGAVMFSSGSNITIDGCWFVKNVALPTLSDTPLAYSGSGGAVFVQSSTISILNSRFKLNRAFTGQFDSGSSGGGITLEDCFPAKIENCSFSRNSAPGFIGKSQYASCGTGGAIYIKFSTVNITQSVFFSNWVSSGGTQNALGGAISVYFDYSSVSNEPVVAGVHILDSQFTNNTAFGQICNQLQAGQGGAIGLVGVANPPVLLENVYFSNNVAYASSASGTLSAGGAIVATFTSNVTARNCSFVGNAAIFGGGDDVSSMASDGGDQNRLSFNNCSFSSRQSSIAKAVYHLLQNLSSALCSQVSSLTGLDSSSGGRRLDDGDKANALDFNHMEEHQLLGWFRDYHLHAPPSNPTALYLNLFGTLVPLRTPEPIVHVKDAHFYSRRQTRLLEEVIVALECYAPQTVARGRDVTILRDLTDELRNHLLQLNPEVLSFNEFDEKLVDKENSLVPSQSEGRYLKLEINPDTFGTLLSAQPSIVIAGGTALFRNPSFFGTYHVFFGDFLAYSTTENTGVETTPNAFYSSIVDMVGDVISEDLIITVLFSKLTIVMPVFAKTMSVKMMNIFNGSLSFYNDIDVKNTSFLYESVVTGLTSSYESVHVTKQRLRPSNISFSGALITGFPLKDLLQKNQQRLRAVIEKLSSNHSSNSSAQSVITFRDCNLVIAGLMSVDSPYRAIFVHSTSATTSLTDFPSSKIVLNDNATITIVEGGTLNIVTSTLILGDGLNRTVLYNEGNISLLGTTQTLLNRQGLDVGKSQELAKVGSLTSTLNIVGTVVQYPSGSFNVWLNHSYQNRPVINLVTNRTLQGSVNVQFYTDDFTLCPNLQYYDDTSASSFQIIAIDFPVVGVDRLAVNAPPGLEFSKKTISSSVPSSPVGTLVQNVLTITNIGCDYIFDYYKDVATSATTGSLYPCHICLSNSSCEYCNDNTCSVNGGCGSSGVQYSLDCCAHDCSPYGDCESKNDYSSFYCDCNNWFYGGDDCRGLTISAIIVVLTACFVVLVMIIVVLLYRRSIVQKAKVLDELREGILRHTETANNEYIQNMQQALILNDVFVKYDEIKIESKIGEGSFGVVYKATFRGAQVAVKQMRSMFFELTDKEIDEFRREAYMMSRLRHPNIVLVMGISLNEQEILPMKSRAKKIAEDAELLPTRSVSSDRKKAAAAKPQKTVCIITEYLEQGSLADILYGPTKLPSEIWTYELILTCALQASRGMLYLHSHQPPICHRDLKSSNLVVDDHWVVKVTDFGMSRIVPEKVQDYDKGIDEDRESLGRNSFIDPSALEGSGSIMVPPSANTSATTNSKNPTTNTSSLGLEMTSNLGTTAWCAPEILTSSSRTRYSVKVDVYSFGMVLWELWEKKRPFDEYTSRFDIIDAVRAGKRPIIDESCPPTFKALIQRCWQAEPSRRPTMNYIVRYLKDELGRVKRNKASATNPTTNRLTMSSYFRTSLSALPLQSASSLGEPTSARSSLSRKSAMYGTGEETGNANFVSFDERKTVRKSSTEGAPGHLSIINPMMAENAVNSSSANLPDSSTTVIGESGRASVTRDSLKNLPEGRTPLVRAVDRSLSYLTESPSVASPLTSNYYKYGGGAWRDRYVMKFSGWNSANPDAGLPPARQQPVASQSSSPLMSFVSGESHNSANTATRPSGSATTAGMLIAQGKGGPVGAPSTQSKTSLAGTPGENESDIDYSTADEHPMFVMETSDNPSSGKPAPPATAPAPRDSVTESLMHTSMRTSHQKRFSKKEGQDKDRPV